MNVVLPAVADICRVTHTTGTTGNQQWAQGFEIYRLNAATQSITYQNYNKNLSMNQDIKTQ